MAQLGMLASFWPFVTDWIQRNPEYLEIILRYCMAVDSKGPKKCKNIQIHNQIHITLGKQIQPCFGVTESLLGAIDYLEEI